MIKGRNVDSGDLQPIEEEGEVHIMSTPNSHNPSTFVPYPPRKSRNKSRMRRFLAENPTPNSKI